MIAIGGKVYTNFCGLNVLGDGVESKSFKIIANYTLLNYENKYYVQSNLGNCAYKTVNTEMVDYHDRNILESD